MNPHSAAAKLWKSSCELFQRSLSCENRKMKITKQKCPLSRPLFWNFIAKYWKPVRAAYSCKPSIVIEFCFQRFGQWLITKVSIQSNRESFVSEPASRVLGCNLFERHCFMGSQVECVLYLTGRALYAQLFSLQELLKICAKIKNGEYLWPRKLTLVAAASDRNLSLGEIRIDRRTRNAHHSAKWPLYRRKYSSYSART